MQRAESCEIISALAIFDISKGGPKGVLAEFSVTQVSLAVRASYSRMVTYKYGVKLPRTSRCSVAARKSRLASLNI